MMKILAYFFSGLLRYGIIGLYIVWLISVLKKGNGTGRVQLEEIAIYALSATGVYLLLRELRTKVLKVDEGD